MPSFFKILNNYLSKRKEKKYLTHIKNISPATILRSNIYEDKVCFSHIGLIGDIIYSIPCMLALAGSKKIELYLDITKETMYPNKFKHYNGNKILTEKSVSFLRPLLLSNPSITKCEVLSDEKIDYDLNEFRRYPFDYRMGSLSRYYFLAFAVNFDLGKSWLNVLPNREYSNKIIVARSFRYRAPTIDYSFLQSQNNIYFIGLQDEYEDMKRMIPNLNYIVTNDALEVAQAIAGCSMFIGNQSFPFAVAEALKVKRVLEVCHQTPNVIVEGENGYDFCFQAQFEQIIKDIN